MQQILAGSYLSSMPQYGFQHLNLRGVTTVTNMDPAPGFDCSTQVGNMLWALIEQGQFPEPDESGGRILYMVFMPTNTPPAGNDAGAHCAPWDFDFPGDVDYAWVGWVGYSSLAAITTTFSHELVEAISDPEPPDPLSSGAWQMDRPLNCGAEIADACWHITDVVNGNTVQAYFSNTQKACVIPFPMPPTITSITPSSGPATGGTSIVIYGTNFDTNGNTKVTFTTSDGATALTFPAVCLSPTMCLATAPPGVGYDDIQITVNRFTTTAFLGDRFNYVPVVNSISKTRGNAGDTLVIQGAGLYWAPAPNTTVSFGNVNVSAACSATSCTVTVPAGGGNVPVTVTVAGRTSAINPFAYFAYVPTVTSLSPASGPISGGTYVNITGAGFDASPSSANMKVLFGGLNGTPSPNVACFTSTWCAAASPAVTAAGPVDVIALAWGVPSDPSVKFTYNLQAMLASLVCSVDGVCGLGLDGNASAFGAYVSLASSDPTVVTVPSVVQIPAGSKGTSFNLTFLPTNRSGAVTITATYLGASVSTTVQFNPWPTVSLILGASVLGTGYSTTATVSLNLPAPAGGAVVTLSSSDPASVPMPASITIPAGAQSKSFTITNSYAGAAKQVTLTATYSGATDSEVISVPTQWVCPARHCPAGTYWHQDDCACEPGLPN